MEFLIYRTIETERFIFWKLISVDSLTSGPGELGSGGYRITVRLKVM